jgi:hypothetical protein
MNLKRAIKNIFNPRFTTSDMERAFTRAGVRNEIIDMFYDDDYPKLPATAMGYVFLPGDKPLKVNWNQHGECLCEGARMNSFDLVHPEQREIDSAKFVCLSLTGIIIVLLFTSLFE